MRLPGFDEIFKLVTASGIAGADTLHAWTNVKGEEHPGEGAGGDGAVGVPWASGEGVHPLEQGGGGETLRPGVVGEAIADVGEKLLAVLQIEGSFCPEDVGERFADTRGPVTANGVGELEKRLAHVAAARIEVRREIL